MLNTDEVDLAFMNDAPPRFAYQILRTGKLPYVGDRGQIISLLERTTKHYLDTKKCTNC